MPDRVPVRRRAMRTYPEPFLDLVNNLMEAILGGRFQGNSR